MGEWNPISDAYEAECLMAMCISNYQADPDQALLLILTPIERKDQFIERRIPFDADTVVPIGRASSTESKQLFEAPENGYIVCPVISRDHAKIECRFDQKLMKLFIRDLRSSHGTKINDVKLVGEHQLRPGDTLEFGTVISRGEETFYPPKYLVDIELRHIDTKQSEISGAQKTGFTVPESDKSDGGSEAYSEEEADDEEEDKQEKSSPTSASFSVHDTTTKPAGLEGGISSEIPRDTSLDRGYPFSPELEACRPSLSDSSRLSLEPLFDIVDIGPISSRVDGDFDMFYPEDDYEPVIPETLEEPTPSTVEKRAAPTNETPAKKPNASASRDFEYDTDVESEAMSDTRYSDLDAESDYDFDAASPITKSVPAESIMLPLTTSPSWALPPSHESVPLFHEYQPPSIPIAPSRINHYQTGPFSLGYPKAQDADMNTELFGHAPTVPGAESELTSYSAPDSLLFSGPLHLPSSTSNQMETLRTRRLVNYEAFGQPLAKSPLTKSMSIGHIINAENSVSRKRKLDEDEAATNVAPTVIPVEPDLNGDYIFDISMFDELEIDFGADIDIVEVPARSTTVVLEGKKKDHAEATSEDVVASTIADTEPVATSSASPTAPASEPVVEQPAQKKRKTNSMRAFFTGTAVGALVGGIGILAGLASLPESYYMS